MQKKILRRKHYFSLALYLLAIPLAHFHSYTALGVTTLVTVIWIMPTAKTDYCPEKLTR